MPRKLDPLVLADLAAGQWGMFTTAQARHQGATPQQVAHLAEAGALDRIRYGVYRIAGIPEHPADRARAAWLGLDPDRTAAARLAGDDPGGVTSHLAAAELLGLGDLPPDAVDITVPRRRQSRLADVRYHLAPLQVADWMLVDGLPTTTAARTIDDLAAGRLDGDHLGRIARDALVTNQLDTSTASAVLRPYAHLYGSPLGDGDAFLDRLLNDAGLPTSLLELAIRQTSSPVETNLDAITKLIQLYLSTCHNQKDENLTRLINVAGVDRLPNPYVLLGAKSGATPAATIRTIAAHQHPRSES